jgi:hypothetical protein
LQVLIISASLAAKALWPTLTDNNRTAVLGIVFILVLSEDVAGTDNGNLPIVAVHASSALQHNSTQDQKDQTLLVQV